MKIVATPQTESVELETFATPAGKMTAAFANDVLVYAMVGPDLEDHVDRWLNKHKLKTRKASERRLASRMQRYFDGDERAFDGLKLGLIDGTEFQRSVWKALTQIPFGKVKSYGDIAREVGKPTGARPVGGAVGSNPITIVIPCHRVVGSAGDLTGFGCGLPVKRVLLKNEGWTIRRDRLPQN